MENRVDSMLPIASLYVGDLHPDVTEALLYETFAKAGQIISLRICRDSTTSRSLGYAYINFNSYSDAEKILDTMNFDLLKGKPMRIMWSQRDPSLRKSGVGNIFIKNLDRKIDNKALYDTFSAFGNILSCKIVLDEDGQSKGHAFVHFDSAKSAEFAIEKVDGMLLNNKKVYVGHFIPRSKREKEINEKNNFFTNIFIKNFGKNFTQENLWNLFAKFGKITSCVIMKNLDGTSKGFGFVNYDNHKSAETAIQEMNNHEIENGHYLYVGRAQTKAERRSELKRTFEQLKRERSTRVQGANVYIKQLDDSIDDENLRKEFSIFGTITSAKVMMENDRSKGFGFVCFSSPEEADRAVAEMNGHILGRKPIYVALAQRKEERRIHLSNLYTQRLRYSQTHLTYTIPPYLLSTVQPGPRFFNHFNQARTTTRWPSVHHQGSPSTPQPLRMNGTYLPTIIQSPINNYRQNLRPLQNNDTNNNNFTHPRPITGQHLLTRPNSRYSAATNSSLWRSSFNNVSSTNRDNGGDNITNAITNNVNTNNTGMVKKGQLLEEQIFRFTEKYYPEMARKITGMLLEMDLSELKDLLKNKESLRMKIEESISVLNVQESNKIITEPSTNL